MFTGPLVIEEVGFEQWEVSKTFDFHSVTGLIITVEKGFTCDLASIPGIAQSLVSKLGYWS